MQGLRVLITGGLGFIGFNLAQRLKRHQDVGSVALLDIGNDFSPFRLSVQEAAEFKVYHVNVLEEHTLLEIVAEFDVVYHLAAESHVQNSIKDPRKFLHTNVMGTFAVLEAARKWQRRLIFASTSEVYGSTQYSPIDESHPLEPQSPYAASKLAADRLVAAYVHSYGLNATIARMFNAFGPRQYYEKLIPMLICSALCDFPLPLQGGGSAKRDWTFVDDVSDRLAALLPESAPKLINLGSGTSKTVAEIATAIIDLVGRHDAVVERYRERPGHVSEQTVDGSAVAARIGPTKVSFEDGLRRTAAWYSIRKSAWHASFLHDREHILNGMSG